MSRRMNIDNQFVGNKCAHCNGTGYCRRLSRDGYFYGIVWAKKRTYSCDVCRKATGAFHSEDVVMCGACGGRGY